MNNGYASSGVQMFLLIEEADGSRRSLNLDGAGAEGNRYYEMLPTLPVGAPTLIADKVEETGVRSVFFTWNGGNMVDFASELLFFNEQTKIIHHLAYIKMARVGEDVKVDDDDDANVHATIDLPVMQLDQKWREGDVDGVLALFDDDSKVLFFDRGSIQMYTGLPAIRGFFESTPNILPNIEQDTVNGNPSSSRPMLSTMLRWDWDRDNETDNRLFTMLMSPDGSKITHQAVAIYPSSEAGNSRFVLA